MDDVLNIYGYKAVICLDPDTKTFRGEFIDLDGSADCYTSDAGTLKHVAWASPRIFLQECEKHGVEPKQSLSGTL